MFNLRCSFQSITIRSYFSQFPECNGLLNQSNLKESENSETDFVLPDLSSHLVPSSLSWALVAAVNHQFCEISLFLPPITGPNVSMLPTHPQDPIAIGYWPSRWQLSVTEYCKTVLTILLPSCQSCVCVWDQHMTFKSQEECFNSYPAGEKCQAVRWLCDQRGSRRHPNCCRCEETTRLTALKGQLSLGNRSCESTRSAMNCELVTILL